MELFDFFLQTGLITSALVIYLIFFRRVPKKGYYRQPGWNYPLKRLYAWYMVRRWKAQYSNSKHQVDETPQPYVPETGWDCITIRASGPDSTTVLLSIRKLGGRKPLAEVSLYVKLVDGSTYRLPQHPDTLTSTWESTTDSWSAGGLKIQILESGLRSRILYNGLLTRVNDNITQHARLNLLWTSATEVVRHPQDWSDQLSADTLALEPWRDENWPNLLGKWEDGNWMQWGTVQGRFQSYDAEGLQDKSQYLRVRGVRERSWAPRGYQSLRRSVTITVTARDGTAVLLRANSYKKVLTQCISGFVRFSDFTVSTLTSTDFVLSQFCETNEEIPKVFVINVGAKNRNLKLVLRINSDDGRFLSGVPYQQEVVIKTLLAEVNGEIGTGILELGYEAKELTKYRKACCEVSVHVITEALSPPVRVTPARTLQWLNEQEAGEVGYCLTFEDRAAACPAYVGGKGASLALLASIQKEEGYKVPPGFCLTIHALNKYLEKNPELKGAIRNIEACSENYDENIFKEKCAKAAELFNATKIEEDLKDAILKYLKELRQNAIDQGLGPVVRFAVRSSAVGEDSDVLSAAGQNETILGCVTDVDVLQGVQKCWASMFSFTSVYYRRQNGQPCLCGGGVVIQALVAPRAAGVMFTRHPDAGDPSRLLITANYGLGESVVSGTVEPDTIIVKREQDGNLTISKTEMGSKISRVALSGDTIAMEEVPEAERGVSCLPEGMALRLAQLGVSQEELWGAGRDIEWAVTDNDIFLLQARPITSLERWTEEELLHELDFPIMADDELTTIANTGEVMPKPMSPLSHDMVVEPLANSMRQVVDSSGTYDRNCIVTHHRVCIALYNSIYRYVPKELDVGVRMLEMAVHGHKVADDNIHATAIRRRSPIPFNNIYALCSMIKNIIKSKLLMKDTIKNVSKIKIHELDEKDPEKFLEAIASLNQKIEYLINNHMNTTYASIGSQFIAISVFLEGKMDFTTEHCSEICTLLSSGDALSAEVPLALDKLARALAASGRADEFRAQEPKKAMQWLRENLPHIHLEISSFLDQYGHRAIMEFDLATKPWALVPENLMEVLQSSCQTKQVKQAQNNQAVDVIASLKTPQKESTRKILKWILPLCRRTVSHREGTKAHLILAVHKLRLALIRLGNLMVKCWFIPHCDLIFFFRLNELRDYLKTRDPALLRKAQQRRQYYPGWCKLKFPELSTGWPEPLKPAEFVAAADDVRIEATSVCAGEVVARACVVKDFSEVSDLQQGDILITHSTDIGWSPYFPLLSGIVTELGGLISHGAVIAREYGLPCIVGATNATDIFKTGDLVRLSSTAGVLERLKKDKVENIDDM